MYRALSVDVPVLLVSMVHQPVAGVSEEDYLTTLSGLHKELVQSLKESETTLHTWNREQAVLQAEETLQKLQRLNVLNEHIEPSVVREHLVRDNQRLSQRVNSETLLSAPETGLILFQSVTEVSPPSLFQTLVQNGQETLKVAQFKVGSAPIGESWFLFRGSLHYEMLEHFLRKHLLELPEHYVNIIALLESIMINTFQLLYQVGTDLSEIDSASEAVIILDEDLSDYQETREQLAGLLEYLAEGFPLRHGSFWQQRGVPGLGNSWMLRFRLPNLEQSSNEVFTIRELISAIETRMPPHVRTVFTRGRLFIGRDVLL